MNTIYIQNFNAYIFNLVSLQQRVSERIKALEAKHLNDITNLQGIVDKSKEEMKQDMETEKLNALQDAETKLAKEHQQILEESLKTTREEADKLRVTSSPFHELFGLHNP